MPDWLWLLIIPFFGALVAYALLMRGRLRAALKTEMERRYGVANLLVVDEKAIYYGLRSRGALQAHELGAVLAVTSEVIHVKTFQGGKLASFELVLPVAALERYYQSQTFVSLGPRSRISGSGLLILCFSDPETGASEELALLSSREAEVHQALQDVTGIALS